MRRLITVSGRLVAVVAVLAVGLVAALLSIDIGSFGGGPNRAAFVDNAVGVADPSTLGLSGDLLLTSRHGTGLEVRSLAQPAKQPVILFGAMFIDVVSPDGRHVVAWTGSRYQIIRLSDLRAIAEVQGSTPFFMDPDRVLLISRGKGCSRRDARILDLRHRVLKEVKLSGDKAGLSAVAIDGGEIVAQRDARGDSGCVGGGFARVDLSTGAVRTITRSGSVAAVSDGHVWITDVDQTKVFDRSGNLLSTTSPRLTVGSADGGVVYAEYPFHLRGGGLPADPPSRLRFGMATGPRADDASGDQLIEPENIVAVGQGKSVLVAHRGQDLPNGGHATVLSRCSVPALRCAELLDVTQDSPRIVGIVTADAFRPA